MRFESHKKNGGKKTGGNYSARSRGEYKKHLDAACIWKKNTLISAEGFDGWES